jgi:hypothetical protein
MKNRSDELTDEIALWVGRSIETGTELLWMRMWLPVNATDPKASNNEPTSKTVVVKRLSRARGKAVLNLPKANTDANKANKKM